MEKLLHLALVFLSGKNLTWLWAQVKGEGLGQSFVSKVSILRVFPLFTHQRVIPVLPDFLTGILLTQNRNHC